MPNARVPKAGSNPATAAAVLAAAVIAAGGLFVFGPFLAAKRYWLTSVADATEGTQRRHVLTTATFAIPARQRACMSSVTVTPTSAIAAFQAGFGEPLERQRFLPLEVTLSARGYQAAAGVLTVGAASRRIEFHIKPPARTLIATVCLFNRGETPVFLEGTTASRTTSRSVLTIAGRRVTGNLTLTFYELHRRVRLTQLGKVLERISNLTDRLVPVWLAWILIVATFCGVPIAVILALHRSLREGPASSVTSD